MLRTLLVVATLVPIAGAQTPAADSAPLVVTGYIASVDTQAFPGFPSGYGLFMTIRNTSTRGILGYLCQTVFTDKETGKPISLRPEPIAQFQSAPVLLGPGSEMRIDRPYPVAMSTFGVLPNYSFSIDVVLFEDGTTWGPAKTAAAKTLLAQIAAFAKIREAQSKPQ